MLGVLGAGMSVSDHLVARGSSRCGLVVELMPSAHDPKIMPVRRQANSSTGGRDIRHGLDKFLQVYDNISTRLI